MAEPFLDVLLSYVYHKRRDLRALKLKLPEGSVIMLDSGAYTAWTTGIKLTREEYRDYLLANERGYDYAIGMDVIGDPHASRLNVEWSTEQGLPVLPVFHFGSPLAEFKSLMRDYDYIAVGGFNPVRRKGSPWLAAYLRTLTALAEPEGIRVHSLGLAGRELIRQSRVWSGDSSTISVSPLSGSAMIYDGRKMQLFLAKDAAKMRKLGPQLARYGFPTGEVATSGRWGPTNKVQMYRAALYSQADMWAEERATRPLLHPGWPIGPRGLAAMGQGVIVAGAEERPNVRMAKLA